MQLFKCSSCNQLVYFDNYYCESCQHILGFDAKKMQMVALNALPQMDEVDTKTQVLVEPNTKQNYKFCYNYQYKVCNWVIENHSEDVFCQACVFNRTIPNLSDDQYRERWHKIELAKHRLIYALLRWNLPKKNRKQNPEDGLAFDFKADPNCSDKPKVLTGHDNGLITLNIAEADDVERAMARNQMDEVYRTLLGHFRHEIGHYYWDVLISNSKYLDECRDLFGDDRLSYQDALDHYYQHGAPVNWMENYISAYATMHPWEDWAETWAHYLHIIDVLETAQSFGMSIKPKVIEDNKLDTEHFMILDVQLNNPYFAQDFEDIYQAWLPVSFAMNSLNRSMGQEDFYPFVINASVKEKLKFMHKVIQASIQKST
jgi:hypothetical protein